MKPALLEVMRMNRICRMVLATCLGSFILVIFYFQTLLQGVPWEGLPTPHLSCWPRRAPCHVASLPLATW
nr:putative CHST11/IgH oncoprotein [Homo sapiens]